MGPVTHRSGGGGEGGGCPQCIASGVLFAYNIFVKREEVKKRTKQSATTTGFVHDILVC